MLVHYPCAHPVETQSIMDVRQAHETMFFPLCCTVTNLTTSEDIYENQATSYVLCRQDCSAVKSRLDADLAPGVGEMDRYCTYVYLINWETQRKPSP